MKILSRFLNGAVSPMVYIMMGVSAFFGFMFGALQDTPDVQRSILFEFQIPVIGLTGWGILLMIMGIICILGLAAKQDSWVSLGSMVGFILWAFAAITYFSHGFYLAFIIIPLFHMLFQAYVFLATSLGYIRRKPSY